MNGKNAELLACKRRMSGNGGTAQSFSGPGDVEALAREFTEAVVFTDLTSLDDNTAVDRIIEDTWDGETFVPVSTESAIALGVTRKVVTGFAGFLRVRHVVRATSGGQAVGATFGSGITYKRG